MAVDFISQKHGYEGITADDLRAHRARLLARDNLMVTVVGDIDAASLAPLLDKLLGGLPAKASVQPVPVPPGSAGSCQVTPMDVPQAVVRVASVTPRLTFRQRLAWSVLDAILNESSAAGRLFREMREKRGLVYGIYSDYLHFNTFGEFEAAFGAKMTEVPEALAVLQRELRRMVEEGPTDAEVATAKPSLIGKTLLGLDTGAAIANLLVNVQAGGQPATYLDDIGGAIKKVTRQEVWDVAKILLNSDHLAVSIAGQPGLAKMCDFPVAQK
jgi:zinc protease